MMIHKPWLWFILGALLGFAVIHPLLMVAAQAMSVNQGVHFGIQKAFSLTMLPWGIGFALFGGLSSYLLAKMRLTLIEDKKLQGAVELAGAACHELNQPMQVILGYAEIISGQIQKEEPLKEYLEEMIAQIHHMDSTLKKVRNITKYKTSSYLKGVRIIDIDKASGA